MAAAGPQLHYRNRFCGVLCAHYTGLNQLDGVCLHVSDTDINRAADSWRDAVCLELATALCVIRNGLFVDAVICTPHMAMLAGFDHTQYRAYNSPATSCFRTVGC